MLSLYWWIHFARPRTLWQLLTFFPITVCVSTCIIHYVLSVAGVKYKTVNAPYFLHHLRRNMDQCNLFIIMTTWISVVKISLKQSNSMIVKYLTYIWTYNNKAPFTIALQKQKSLAIRKCFSAYMQIDLDTLYLFYPRTTIRFTVNDKVKPQRNTQSNIHTTAWM